MTTPPVFIGEVESAWNSTTTPKNIALEVQPHDSLVLVGVTADAAKTLNTPTGGGLIWTLKQSHTVASNTAVYLWTASATAAQTSFILSVTATGAGGQFWGFNCLRFGNSTGIGASAKNAPPVTGTPSLAITTTGVNSALVCVHGDWNAIDGATRVWLTINSITPIAGGAGENTYFRDAAQYSTYSATWIDVGAAGAKTVGLSTPGGQKYAIAAVEVFGGEDPITGDLRTVYQQARPGRRR